jgi:hypothetical protein
MPNDLSNRAPSDRSRINMSEAWEVRWWCVELGVTEDELRQAVDTVGPTPAEVERHLKKAARESMKQMGES